MQMMTLIAFVYFMLFSPAQRAVPSVAKYDLTYTAHPLPHLSM